MKGIVAISGHGSGEGLFRRPDLRALAGELHLAMFTFETILSWRWPIPVAGWAGVYWLP
jgi:hypothetical protein